MMQRCGVEAWKNTPRGGKNNEEELSAISHQLSGKGYQLSSLSCQCPMIMIVLI